MGLKTKQGVVALDQLPGPPESRADAQDSPAPETATVTVEAKQAVITSADVKSGKRFRVTGLRGGFGRTHFGDDCVTSRPVDEETEEQLRSSFGDAVEVIE